jgi:hypothetical protein
MKKKSTKLPPHRFIVDNPLEPKFPRMILVEKKYNEEIIVNNKKVVQERTDIELQINGSPLCKVTWDGYFSLCHLDDNLKMLGFKWDEQGYVKLRKEKP